MCVIIVCPRGVDIPSKRILIQASRFNSHGYGFVSENDYFRTMDFDEFYDRVKKVSKKENLIIHMRYATHGSIKIENCHPFYDDGVYFAHNGVLDIEPIGDMTDSETAFKTEIREAINDLGFESGEFHSFCKRFAGMSKFAFMNKGDIKLVGYYHEINGVYYSNIRFMGGFKTFS